MPKILCLYSFSYLPVETNKITQLVNTVLFEKESKGSTLPSPTNNNALLHYHKYDPHDDYSDIKYFVNTVSLSFLFLLETDLSAGEGDLGNPPSQFRYVFLQKNTTPKYTNNNRVEGNGSPSRRTHTNLSPFDYSTRVQVEGCPIVIEDVIASDVCFAIYEV